MRMLIVLVAVLCAVVGAVDEARADAALPPEGVDAQRGLVDVFVDEDAARVWLRFDEAAADDALLRCIYTPGLRSGLGSNPVGLDRGLMAEAKLVRFVRIGGRVLLVEENTRYRADSDDDAERAAVAESFATSVIWSGARLEDGDGRTLVEITSFLTSDQMRVATRLADAEQGMFSLDAESSVVIPSEALVFPRNLEFDALVTYRGDDPGREVRSTSPAADVVTLTAHHSFVALPDEGYQPRMFHPQVGAYPVVFHDYASPIADPIERRLMVRWRLEKVTPGAAPSRVKDPIVYYVDPGAPEPIRSALIEGARWWADAFEAAGFIDAFRVETLPADAHPLDARYNVIEWVHRATRGWSYGGGVVDPRTGEIIKGHVSLGSLRVRQDRLLFEGLLGTESTGTGAPDDPVQLALARLRQLSAHEVGHTLGIAHNFSASTYGGRASVMDYPAPLIDLDEVGRLDVSEAYGVGVGEWDVHTIRCMYEQFEPGEEARALAELITEGRENGYLFHSDQDARAISTGAPSASLWDNGHDAIESLRKAMRIRSMAMERFGVGNIAGSQPVALLQEVFATVYFHHRFQLNAAAKLIGGAHYSYAMTDDPSPGMTPVDADRQREALDGVLACLAASSLETPAHIEALLIPRPFGYGRNREMFPSRVGTEYDSVAAAQAGAEMVFDAIFNPARLARVDQQHQLDARWMSLEELFDRTLGAVIDATPELDSRMRPLAEAVEASCVDRLIALCDDAGASPHVRAASEAALRRIARAMSDRNVAQDADDAHARRLGRVISVWLVRGDAPGASSPGNAITPPPGQPIGASTAEDWCSHGAGVH